MPWNNERGDDPEFDVKKTEGSDVSSSSETTVQIIQKIIAEVIGTFFVIFTGCGSVVVEKMYGSVTFPGICVVWGLIVMVMVYSVGHISGAHFNPAVTVTFAIFRHFPYKQVPLYMVAQLLGSLLASGTLSLLFNVPDEAYFGTIPVGPDIRPVSGASMNPARSLGPAIVMRKFKGIWVYLVAPPIGTILGALCYNLIRFTDKPLREITKTASFLKSKS
ncbi:AQUAPORIN NIP2-1 [Salix koriyanagi]|uniref:AQUAPORIN NIP2-1 n=1 Tax=Salix koriyanagi TaxID=2511006 RepID=A0A9Q0WTL0_9ROSI|nr:AQUAPORIN NIP2-1 [Salix koriyanagi]